MDMTELQIDVSRQVYATIKISDLCLPSGPISVSYGALAGMQQRIVNFWSSDSELGARDLSIPGACGRRSRTNYRQKGLNPGADIGHLQFGHLQVVLR